MEEEGSFKEGEMECRTIKELGYNVTGSLKWHWGWEGRRENRIGRRDN